MKYITFILFMFFLLPLNGYADLQERSIDTIEPGFGEFFSEWEKNLDLTPIYYEMSS